MSINAIEKIDLHMHSAVSDGTDSPAELLTRVKKAGISLFSLTDHDAIKGCELIWSLLTRFADETPAFITGVEFSCKDEKGKYHILGYGYDPEAKSIRSVVDKGHALRMKKARARLDFLKTEYGFTFPHEETDTLLSMDNPGKPHIGNLMVKYKYAATKEQAIKNFIDNLHFKSEYVSPKEAVSGIIGAGGIPVLAHPFFGDGDQLIVGAEMRARLECLIEIGIRGVEAFYSGFTPKLRNEMLALAEEYNLYVTAGSDYHGKNKLVEPGDTGMDPDGPVPPGMKRFTEDVAVFQKGR